MLPAPRGADIAATRGGGAARAPPGVGPRTVRAKEDLGATRFSMPHAGAPKRSTAGAFLCASDTHACGNYYPWRIVLFAGGNVVYCWRITVIRQG
jgi:hypothetical protein